MSLHTNTWIKQKNYQKLPKFKYSLKFASIITPNTIKNLSLANTNSTKIDKNNKILIKQSYLLLIWLMYIRGSYSEFNDNQKIPSFFIHKKSQSKVTKLKAPMAHKTFSQEQFIFKFYTLSISFKTQCNPDSLPSSINKSIYVILNLRSSLPFFTTNLLFLKNFKFSLYSFDSTYMTLI